MDWSRCSGVPYKMQIIASLRRLSWAEKIYLQGFNRSYISYKNNRKNRKILYFLKKSCISYIFENAVMKRLFIIVNCTLLAEFSGHWTENFETNLLLNFISVYINPSPVYSLPYTAYEYFVMGTIYKTLLLLREITSAVNT